MKNPTRSNGSSRTTSHLRRWLPAVLLIAIVCANRVATAQAPLTPWELGGMGMFATTDAAEVRIVRVEASIDDGRRIPVELSWQTADLEREAKVWPRTGVLQELLGKAMDLRYQLEDGVLVVAPDPEAAGEGGEYHALVSPEVTVYRLEPRRGAVDVVPLLAFRLDEGRNG